MKMEILSFANGNAIPGQNAFCIPDEINHVTFGGNKSPHIRWADIPEVTKSLALICHDPDVPSKPDDVNKEGRTVPEDLPRVDFYHWVLVDIPPNLSEFPEGMDSDGVTAHGKEPGQRDYGVRGLNDYTNWFAGDENMGGNYAGYDGPCPPWNDERLHHYHFKLYALDIATLDLGSNFSGKQAEEKMKGHILAVDEWVGTYTFNKNLKT